MVFPVTEVCTDRLAGFKNEASMTGAHRLNSDIVSEVMSKNYGRE